MVQVVWLLLIAFFWLLQFKQQSWSLETDWSNISLKLQDASEGLGAPPSDQQRNQHSSSIALEALHSSATIESPSRLALNQSGYNLDDEPAGLSLSGKHSGSLAKRKLLLKTTPSMLNSAVINGKVSLACDISPANADDSVALILWYKDDSLAPIYTIDARKANSLEQAKITIDELYSKRASFEFHSKPGELRLERIRQEDEGDYRCRVDFKKGRTVNTIISLRVLVPPDELSIVTGQRGQARLEGLVGPFNEGSPLELVCLAVGGKPRPQLTWRRDFNVIDETFQHVDKEGTSVSLKIPALTKDHLLSIFTCQASNNNLTSPMQTSITLDLNLKPQEVSLKQLRSAGLGGDILVAGQTVTFECLTHGSRPQATLHWLFQGIRHDTPMNIDQQQTSARLTLNLQRSFNQQMLTCVAENPRISKSSAISQSIKLDVHYAPQLSIRLDQPTQRAPFEESASVQEGNDIYLVCQIDANPRPLKPILWRLNGKPLQSNSALLVMNNQSLVLRKIARHQAGFYTCEATNQLGSNSSKPLELQVKYAPVCSSDDILVYEANLGQSISLDCNVQANPAKSVHYSWFSAPDERNISAWLQRDSSLDEQIDESSSRLKLKLTDESKFSHSSLFKCKAKNEIGLQQKPCLFKIQPAIIPTLHHECSLLNSSSTSIHISCKPNEHLKSEAFELVRRQQQSEVFNSQSDRSPLASSSGMSGWLNLAAIKSLAPQASLADGQASQSVSLASQLEPNYRLVFPPTWLLAELYRRAPAARQAMHSSSKPDSNEQEEEEQNHELVAYIVVSSGVQLAHVKAIVEQNGLLSSKPRSVYYVQAKQFGPPFDSGASGNVNNNNNNNNNETFNSLEQLLSGDNSASRVNQIVLPLSRPGESRQQIQDSSIQLASSFTFQVPNLEPNQKYKLVIYGQNLANRTRDWLVINADTQSERVASISNGQQLVARLAHNPSHFDQLDTSLISDQSKRHSNYSTPIQQKSIVMRSENDNDLTSDQATDQVALDGSNSSVARSPYSSFIDRKLEQLAHYKDSALSYARQRPLLSVPIGLVLISMLCFLLAWTGGLLIQLARGDSREVSEIEINVTSNNNNKQLPATSQQNGHISSPSDKKSTQLKSEIVTFEPNTKVDQFEANLLELTPPTAVNFASQLEQHLNLKDTPLELQTERCAQSSVYAINVYDQNQFERLYPVASLQRGALVGSLDRRKQQPIYLETNQQHYQPNYCHQHAGSIDGLAFLDQHQQQQILLANLELPASIRTSSGSRQARQRVAFDLSNQRPRCRATLTSTPLLEAAQASQVTKCSDSGASSNSGNTLADSGHESPPTADTNTTSAASYSRTTRPASTFVTSGGGQLGLLVEPNGHSGGHSNGLVMLMELSPGSQESSTLLHSVDSFAELPSSLSHLHNNHQMATSFATAQSSNLEQRDLDNWL